MNQLPDTTKLINKKFGVDSVVLDGKLISKEDTVYISGKMRGLPELNFPAFNAMEKHLKEKYGCVVINPASHQSDLTWEQYMEIDKACVRASTVLVQLESWIDSPGSQIEYMEAKLYKKRIYKEGEV